MLQGLLWTVLAVLLLSVLFNVILFHEPYSASEDIPRLSFALLICIALWLNHRRKFRQAVGTVLAATLGAATYPLLMAGLVGNELWLFLYYVPVVLAGLLLGRRTLFLVGLFTFFILFLTPYLEANGQLFGDAPPSEPGWLLAGQFALVLAVVLFFLDRIGTSLNRALRELARREVALKREMNERRLVQDRLAMALTAARMATYETDTGARTVTGSEELERLFGLPGTNRPRQLDDFLELIHPQDRALVMPFVPSSDGGQHEGEVEFRVVRPDGRVAWLSAVSKVVSAGADSRERLVGIVMDTTETKEAQLALEELNQTLEERVAERTTRLQAANEELEAFAYTVSHDLRAPLRGMDGFSQLLMEEHSSSLDDEAKGYVRRIKAAANRMGELIDDLLELSSISGGEVTRSEVDLGEMAYEIAAELNEMTGRKTELVVEGQLKARGDPRLLRITLENLLSNAWKFMGDQETPQVVLGSRRQGRTRVYYVKDNGVGFDMAHASKLFTPFQRLQEPGRFEGTGIGLATVQRIIHRHGGEIWGDGRPGEGATFSFTLEPSSSYAPRS